jgi:enoyl-CoA hydratase/carnithine racemase
MPSTTEKMIAKKEDGIGWMIFNSPARLNAVSFDMWQAVPEILGDFAADDAVRVVVITGAGGKAFVSGADISEFEEKRGSKEAVETYNAAGTAAHLALSRMAKPTIAMIRGYCIGGGMAVALDCDLRIAAEGSRFGVPAAKLGLGYAYDGIARLSGLVGPAVAKEIFFTARQFSGEEAFDMGLVNRQVPANVLEDYVRDYARTIGANAPLTIGAVKMAVTEYLKDPEKRDLDAVQAAVDTCFASEDYVEGRTAFMEKRPPQFKGR